MKKIQVSQIDAFTNKLFGGNPAGVVLHADILTDDEMKKIAREMNLSETAFVLKPTRSAGSRQVQDADVKLRFFTCGKDEIKFCGHATIAALYEIGRTGSLGTEKNGDYTFRIETNAGILPMTIIKKSDVDISIKFIAPVVQFEKYQSQHEEFAKRLGIPLKVINTSHPVMIDKNLNYIYLAINSLKELGELRFDFQHIENNFRKEGIVIFCLMTPEAFDKENDIHARGLAPLVGVPEDPFTGSMQASLATYVVMNGLVAENKNQIRVEQGHFIDRPGFAVIDYPENSGDSILVTGGATHVFTTEMTL